MAFFKSADDLRRAFNRFREKLWVRPAVVGLLSVAAALLAHVADYYTALGEMLPPISQGALEATLTVMASSMLAIATFAVASMVSAYASASNVATPRTFSLVLADDVSQNALSTFIGAFIFSIVALPAVKSNYFERAGLTMLAIITGAVFAAVVLTFVRWMDRIARLGRLGSTVDLVEAAAAAALQRRRREPTLGGAPLGHVPPHAKALFSAQIGYVQHIDMLALQAFAEKHDARVCVSALPGTFAAPGRVLAHVVLPLNTTQSESENDEQKESTEADWSAAARAFEVGNDRRYGDDPRFGLIVLSEIASRALSPAVNDPGTAIDVIGTLVRLFAHWAEPGPGGEAEAPTHARVEVPALEAVDLFDDAFTGLARDGAGCVEVMLRLQKALHSLASLGDPAIRAAALHHSQLALERANHALTLAADRVAVQSSAQALHLPAGRAPDAHAGMR